VRKLGRPQDAALVLPVLEAVAKEKRHALRELLGADRRHANAREAVDAAS
jgi:hypothetical protein